MKCKFKSVVDLVSKDAKKRVTIENGKVSLSSKLSENKTE